MQLAPRVGHVPMCTRAGLTDVQVWTWVLRC